MKERPLITFLLVCYNQERYVKEAVAGALSQTYSPLEIVISDDASTDSTFDIVQAQVAEYKGPHTLKVIRNRVNLGICGNINTAMELAGGELVVAAAGDDVSYSHRVERLYSYWIDNQNPIYSIFSSADYIDKNGVPCGQRRVQQGIVGREALKREGRAHGLGATQAWRREVFDIFGPINSDVVSEDVVIPFRAALLGGVGFLDEKLVAYRIGVGFSSEISVNKCYLYKNAIEQHRRDIDSLHIEDDQLKRVLTGWDAQFEVHIGLHQGKIWYPLLFAFRNGLGLAWPLRVATMHWLRQLGVIAYLRKLSGH